MENQIAIILMELFLGNIISVSCKEVVQTQTKRNLVDNIYSADPQYKHSCISNFLLAMCYTDRHDHSTTSLVHVKNA